MDNIGEDFRRRLMSIPERGVTTASFWRRAMAFILDLLVLNFIVFSSFREFFLKFVEQGKITGAIPSDVYLAILFSSVLALLYFSLLQHYFQQTLGMMLFRIHVLPKPGFWHAVFRNIFILPFFPFTLLWIIEPLYLYFKGNRLLEKLTGTSTVEVSHG